MVFTVMKVPHDDIFIIHPEYFKKEMLPLVVESIGEKEINISDKLDIDRYISLEKN